MSTDLSDGLFTVKCDCGETFRPEDEGVVVYHKDHKHELLLDVEKMLERAYNAESRDKAIDVIFDVYYHLYNRFDLMNEILKNIDVNKLDGGMICSILTQTFRYIPQVPEHMVFYEKCKIRLKDLGYPDDRIKKVLDGFDNVGDYWENAAALGIPEWLTGPNPNRIK